MTWKSYAAASGATVLAGWLASWSAAPQQATVSSPAARPTAARAAALDISKEADRLQTRVAREREYLRPERDPFRFTPRGSVAALPPATVELPASEPPPAIVTPPPASLSGIAEDETNGRIERTAVLSLPSDVLLVREGDEIPGRYRVIRIESDAVELQSLDTGQTVRLSLR